VNAEARNHVHRPHSNGPRDPRTAGHRPGSLSVIDETWADDMTWHGGSLGTFEGKEASLAFATENVTRAFEDMHLEIEDVIACEDKVVLRFTNSGNVGPFMNHPPSGKHAEWLGIGIYTLRDGRITEGWFAEDVLGMPLQLDALSPPT
jgi:predicted ester cyclase